MTTFIPIMAAHLLTTALGALYVYRKGATLPRVVALGLWAVLFFPVVHNVVKFLG